MYWQEALDRIRSITDRYSMREDELRLLYRVAMELEVSANIVELGVYRGRSMVALATAANARGCRYLGIDDWRLDGTYEECLKILNNIAPNLCSLAKDDTHAAGWQPFGPVDLLVVDAGHEFDDVMADCRTWIPKVKPGGYVAFHDYHTQALPPDDHWGVRAAADAYTSGWYLKGYVDSLLIRRRP